MTTRGKGDAVNQMNDFLPGSVLGQATSGDDMTATSVTALSTGALARRITGWILGVGIALLVLKIVLTAVSRIVSLDDPQSCRREPHPLERVPLVGAYPAEMGWPAIWISFGTNLAVILGAWAIVAAITGLIEWFFLVL